MNAFEYRRAATVREAVAWLRDVPDAKLLAGGQTLLASMQLGMAAPPVLIDLQSLPELKDIRAERGSLWVGAMCTHARIAASPLVRDALPGVAELAGGIADQQIRNRGTIGGSVANADPAACWPAGLLACGATLTTDRREIVSDDFFQGLFTTALAPDEVLLGVRFPCAGAVRYVKFEQAASRFALVGAAVWRGPNAVRVAITGLGHGVLRWPEAEALLARRFEPLVLMPAEFPADRCTGDLHASAGYRAHLASVLTARAVGLHLEKR
jgi:carbon-monoxide dehydrogenase medium subunit